MFVRPTCSLATKILTLAAADGGVSFARVKFRWWPTAEYNVRPQRRERAMTVRVVRLGSQRAKDAWGQS